MAITQRGIVRDRAGHGHLWVMNARPSGTCRQADGPWQTVCGLFGRWQRNRTWRKILTALQGRADPAGPITWEVPVDSTGGRAHQHAAGARKTGDLQAEPPGGVQDERTGHGPGRSRGGLTAKVHLPCEQGHKPLSVVIRPAPPAP